MIDVAFLTTWGSNCGISTYSEELCECLVDTGEARVQVLAPMEENSCTSPPERIPYRMIWNRNDPNLPLTISDAAKDCDIVHIQHEYGLFRHHEAFIQLLTFLRKANIKTVVTMHTVFPYGGWKSGVIDSIKSNADMLITHTPEAFAALLLARGKALTCRIPHGTRTNIRPGNRTTGFEILGIPKNIQNASFGGSIGFMSPGKNIHQTLFAWAEGINRRLIDPSRSGYIICGEISDDVYFYREELERYRRDCGYAENIFIVPKFIRREDMRHVMAALDYAVLNTTSETLSASGQVHALAAHGVPSAAVDRPIYRDAINAGAIPFGLKKENVYSISTINAISALASNPGLRMDMKHTLLSYTKATGWPIQAARHIEAYKVLLK